MKDKPTVKLIGRDGNAFAILGRVVEAMKENGATKKETDKYIEEATSGDYNNLLVVTNKYVNIE